MVLINEFLKNSSYDDLLGFFADLLPIVILPNVDWSNV
jgi:hypothetical protein